MSERFIKFIPSEEEAWLMSKHPFAFLLLTLIAKRARRLPGLPDGLGVGECHIGDHESIGATRGQYRHALKVLLTRKYLTILETCRTRQKATTGTTTIGTKVKLLNSDIWDINAENHNHRNNHLTTTEQPPNNHEQETIRNEERKNKKETISKEAVARSVDLRSFLLNGRIEEEVGYFEEISKGQGFAFQKHVLIRWAQKWGVSYISDIFQLLLKEIQLCEKNPTKKPILKPEAWMERALDKNFIEMGITAQKNMELAMQLRQNGWSNLEVKTRHAVDNTTGKDFMYNHPEFERIIMFEYERIKEG